MKLDIQVGQLLRGLRLGFHLLLVGVILQVHLHRSGPSPPKELLDLRAWCCGLSFSLFSGGPVLGDLLVDDLVLPLTYGEIKGVLAHGFLLWRSDVGILNNFSDKQMKAANGVAIHDGASVDLIGYVRKIVASESKFDEEGWNLTILNIYVISRVRLLVMWLPIMMQERLIGILLKGSWL